MLKDNKLDQDGRVRRGNTLWKPECYDMFTSKAVIMGVVRRHVRRHCILTISRTIYTRYPRYYEKTNVSNLCSNFILVKFVFAEKLSSILYCTDT